LPAYLDPRHPGQHPVEQNYIRLALGDSRQRLFAVGGFADGEAFLLEVVAQQRDDRDLVIDDEDERLHGLSPPRPTPS